MKKESFNGLKYEVVEDISDILADDYNDLFKNIMTTLALVFMTLLMFI
jgi:multidrug efflux pump subunit AcrB